MKYLYFILFYLISFQLKAQNTVSPKRDIDSDSICLKNGIIPGHVPLLTGIPIKTMTFQMWLKKIGLKHKKSKLIKLTDESEDFESLPGFQMHTGILSPTIKSDDQDFIAFFSIQPNNNRPPFILKDKVEYDGKEVYRYLFVVRAELAMSLNKKREDISFDEIKHYIEYKPASYAKDVFNADTVITYPLSLGSECFRKKYCYCDVWLFQKNNIGHFYLYCFYTDKGYENKWKYEQELEKTLRFKK